MLKNPKEKSKYLNPSSESGLMSPPKARCQLVVTYSGNFTLVISHQL